MEPADRCAADTRAGGCRVSATTATGDRVHPQPARKRCVESGARRTRGPDRLPGRSFASRVDTYITRSGDSIGSPRRQMALTMVKKVVLTPMPSPSVNTARRRGSWSAPQCPQGVAKVATQIFELHEQSRIAVNVLHQRDAAHCAPRRQAGFVGRQPATAMVFFEQRQIGRELAIEFAVGVSSPKHVEQSTEKTTHRPPSLVHGPRVVHGPQSTVHCVRSFRDGRPRTRS